MIDIRIGITNNHFFPEKINGNRYRSSNVTNIPLPVEPNNKLVSPTEITAARTFGKNQGHLSVVNLKQKHMPDYSNLDLEECRPKGFNMENMSSGRGQIVKYPEQSLHSCLEVNKLRSNNELAVKKKCQNNKGQRGNVPIASICSPVQRDSGRSSSSSPVSSSIEPRKKVHPAVKEHKTTKSDNVVKGTSLDNAPSTIDIKTFKTSSSDSESFNATEYKGERTYF